MNKKGLFLFNRNERVKKRSRFKEIFKNGNYLKSDYYNCMFLKNNFLISRIGIVVKKNIGNAVIRNYEKRIVREFFRCKKKLLKDYYDIVFIVKKKNGSFLDKKKDFEKILFNIQCNDNK